MQEYFGSETAVAAQKLLRDLHPEIEANPALSNGGRILNILDLDAVGIEAVADFARRFGFVGITAVPISETRKVLSDHFGDTVKAEHWLVYLGEAEAVVPACRAIVEGFEMPKGWTISRLAVPDDHEVEQIAELSLACGVAPSPVYFMRSEVLPSLTTCVHDETGRLVAAASASQRYHPDGRFGDTVFAGSVAVSPDMRGMGLGRFINASLLLESQARFAWRRILEQARPDNAPSRAMIRACGLQEDLDLGTFAVNLSGEVLTR